MRQPLVAALVVVGLFGMGVRQAGAGAATRVSASRWHTCAITSSGGVVCWGHNAYGQLGDGTATQRSAPVPVSGIGTTVKAIAAGRYHSCALTTGGAVVCWGANFYGALGDGTTTPRVSPVAVIGLASGVAAIAAGADHTCALTATGAVLCWGRNADGQLGNGTTTNQTTPAVVTGLGSGVASITAGEAHSCAVTTAGSPRCWGRNSDGQLGDATTTSPRLTPSSVSGLASGVATMSAGTAHTCAVTAVGGALCWGRNAEGQVGDNSTTRRLSPAAVSGLSSGVLAIAAGGYHTVAVLSAGGVVAWGYNQQGQAGGGTFQGRLTPASAGSTGASAAAIAAGGTHTCAVNASGEILCWGANSEGQLGDGTASRRLSPVRVRGFSAEVWSVAVGPYHACAVQQGGAASCWGANDMGALGDGTSASRSTPGLVSGLASGAVSVAVGSHFSCARTGSGAVYCWGDNNWGQIGDGTYYNRSAPTPVSTLGAGVSAITTGSDHACALKSGGNLVCWGFNTSGQIGDGSASTSQPTPVAVSGLGAGVTAVSAGYSHTCAVKAGGTVACWGYNSDGQLGNGNKVSQRAPVDVPGLANVVAVSAGMYHTCAVTAAGAAYCWGMGSWSQLGDGTATDRLVPTQVLGLTSGVTAIASGNYHSCARTSGGDVKCWGNNGRGEVGDGAGAYRTQPYNVAALTGGAAGIAAGGSSSCATTAVGGMLFCWGDDASGQLGLGSRAFATLPFRVYGYGGAIGGGGISPTQGPAVGSTEVTITGAYFQQGATVTIGGIPPWSSTVVNTETITATTAPGVAGASDVVVRNPDGSVVTLAGAFTYTGAVPGMKSDFSGDLKSDVLWHHAGRGEVWLWPMNGAARTAESFVRTVGEAGWQIRGTGDQTGDGKADVLWRHAPTGMVYLWTMNGSSIQAETYVGTVDPAYDIVGTGDYNGDGKSDLLWRHLSNGELWVWLMNGTTIVSATYVTTVDPGYAVQGSGDLNGDGKADIVWRHQTAGDVWVWLMNGATPTEVTYLTTVPDTGYRIVGVADHTGDGKADILWHHATRGEVWLWRMNATTLVSQSYVDAVPDTGYRIVGNGDYNGDGRADILWHHATRGEVWVWLMNGATKLAQQYVGSVPDVQYQIVR